MKKKKDSDPLRWGKKKETSFFNMRKVAIYDCNLELEVSQKSLFFNSYRENRRKIDNNKTE